MRNVDWVLLIKNGIFLSSFAIHVGIVSFDGLIKPRITGVYAGVVSYRRMCRA